MAVEKLSVSMPGVVVARARRAADRAGVPLSTWLAEAAEAAADLAEAQAAAQDYADRFGELKEFFRREAQRFEVRLGLPLGQRPLVDFGRPDVRVGVDVHRLDLGIVGRGEDTRQGSGRGGGGGRLEHGAAGEHLICLAKVGRHTECAYYFSATAVKKTTRPRTLEAPRASRDQSNVKGSTPTQGVGVAPRSGLLT